LNRERMERQDREREDTSGVRKRMVRKEGRETDRRKTWKGWTEREGDGWEEEDMKRMDRKGGKRLAGGRHEKDGQKGRETIDRRKT
jgi:hypothetical protein